MKNVEIINFACINYCSINYKLSDVEIYGLLII